MTYTKSFVSRKNLSRKIRFFFQRLIRGWDDSECWSLDHSLAKAILPRLKRFKELHIGGHPGHLDSQEQWHAILDEMILGFEIIASDKYWGLSDNDNDKVNRAVDLFAEHYRALWH